jgi:hypothetical protein
VVTRVAEEPTPEFTFVLKMKTAGSLKMLVTIFEAACHRNTADNHLSFHCLEIFKFHPTLLPPSSL